MEEFNIQDKQISFYKYCPGTLDTPLYNDIFFISTWQIIQCGTTGCVVNYSALRYKPEVHGFDPRWYHWNFLFT